LFLGGLDDGGISNRKRRLICSRSKTTGFGCHPESDLVKTLTSRKKEPIRKPPQNQWFLAAVFFLLAGLALSNVYGKTPDRRAKRPLVGPLSPYHQRMDPATYALPRRAISALQDSNTNLIGRWANDPCHAVAVNGNMASFGYGGYLKFANISNPSNPVGQAKVLTPSVVKGVVISGSSVYVADGYAGLRISMCPIALVPWRWDSLIPATGPIVLPSVAAMPMRRMGMMACTSFRMTC